MTPRSLETGVAQPGRRRPGSSKMCVAVGSGRCDGSHRGSRTAMGRWSSRCPWASTLPCGRPSWNSAPTGRGVCSGHSGVRTAITANILQAAPPALSGAGRGRPHGRVRRRRASYSTGTMFVLESTRCSAPSRSTGQRSPWRPPQAEFGCAARVGARAVGRSAGWPRSRQLGRWRSRGRWALVWAFRPIIPILLRLEVVGGSVVAGEERGAISPWRVVSGSYFAWVWARHVMSFPPNECWCLPWRACPAAVGVRRGASCWHAR